MLSMDIPVTGLNAPEGVKVYIFLSQIMPSYLKWIFNAAANPTIHYTQYALYYVLV